jgi:hypothetical protein
LLYQKAEGGRQKAEGGRQKAEGRRQKAEAEGRNQKAEGRNFLSKYSETAEILFIEATHQASSRPTLLPSSFSCRFRPLAGKLSKKEERKTKNEERREPKASLKRQQRIFTFRSSFFVL